MISPLASQVSQFDVNHAQVTNGLDVAVGIHKGIISMSNSRYAEAWKLLRPARQLFGEAGEQLRRVRGSERHLAAAEPAVPADPGQGRRAMGRKVAGSRSSARRASPGKFGVFPEPPITTASSPLALRNLHGRGHLACRTATASGASPPSARTALITPAKTATVMNFMARLFTAAPRRPAEISGNGADIPTETGAPMVNLPGLNNLVPTQHGADGDRRGPRQRAVDRGDELGIPALPGGRRGSLSVFASRAVAVRR